VCPAALGQSGQWCDGTLAGEINVTTLVGRHGVEVPTPDGPERAYIGYPERRADWVCLRLDDRSWSVVSDADLQKRFTKVED
jgi:hypothetical protein